MKAMRLRANVGDTRRLRNTGTSKQDNRAPIGVKAVPKANEVSLGKTMNGPSRMKAASALNAGKGMMNAGMNNAGKRMNAASGIAPSLPQDTNKQGELFRRRPSAEDFLGLAGLSASSSSSAASTTAPNMPPRSWYANGDESKRWRASAQTREGGP